MRMAALVAKNGIDRFTPDDFHFVSRKIATDPDRLILVGGQAVEVWSVLFNVPSPLGDGVALTEDADWLGSKLDAKWLCDQLAREAKVELQFAPDFDATPSSAIAYIQRGNRILLMDFLRTIVGPGTEEIRKLAVRVQLDGCSIDVLHPLLCLHSRLSNLQVLASKRLGNGPTQAKWMIDITRAYLLRMVEEGQQKDSVASACRRIAQLSEFEPGKYCFVNFSIDALMAIPVEALQYVGGKFLDIEWPIVTARISTKRAHWVEVKSRNVQHICGS